MDQNKQLINQLLVIAGLPQALNIRHLGAGELNNSYFVKTIDNREFCIRIAKYVGKKGLRREADALMRLPEGIAPKLVYVPSMPTQDGKWWILESYIPGETPVRLSVDDFATLGRKLAIVHSIGAPDHDIVDPGEVTGPKDDLWLYLVWCCRSFYSENLMLHDLPDKRLLSLCRKSRLWFAQKQSIMKRQQTKRLLHKDATPSNLLVRNGEIFLIDWELRDFGDPMLDFATCFWDDIEYNRGKWRILLSQEEKTALFSGYAEAGGKVDEERISLWITFDKLGSAVFLCHRIHNSPDGTSVEKNAQYKEDYEAILKSLYRIIV